MGSSAAFAGYKIYIDSHKIRPATQRGQQKPSARNPSALQSFCICFLPVCLSQSCHPPQPILQWLAFSSALCCSYRCHVQLGHGQVPAARWRALLFHHKPSSCNTRLKVRRLKQANSPREAPQQLQKQCVESTHAQERKTGSSWRKMINWVLKQFHGKKNPITFILQRRLYL